MLVTLPICVSDCSENPAASKGKVWERGIATKSAFFCKEEDRRKTRPRKKIKKLAEQISA